MKLLILNHSNSPDALYYTGDSISFEITKNGLKKYNR